MQMALHVDNAIGPDSNDYEIDECSLSSLRLHLCVGRRIVCVVKILNL